MSDQSVQIVLASTSPYRKELMEKLAIEFSQVDPEYLETPLNGESPAEKALRLARGKALAGARKLADPQAAIVIGSDQVASCEGRIFSKPCTKENAIEQLQHCSGKWSQFSTGVSLVNEQGRELASFVDVYELKFRDLSDQLISRYLDLDQPYDCAGSIKAESHGIMLIERTSGKDINTLYGLPLLELNSTLLRLDAINNFK